MKKHFPAIIIIALFLILVVGAFMFLNNLQNSDRSAVIEGTIEEIIFYDQDFGEIIVKC